jgi:hypothetical protein
MVNKYPFLEINRQIFQSGRIPVGLSKFINIPKRKFPEKFEVRGKNSVLTGYFSCFNKSPDKTTLLKIFEESRWGEFNDIAADFLFIFLNFNKSEVMILTDQSGKFPIFFSTSKDNYFRASPSFQELKNRTGSTSLDAGATLNIIARQMFITEDTVVNEIKKLPPFTILKVNKQMDYSLHSLFNPWKFISEEKEKYDSLKNFTDDFITLLNHIVEEKIQKVGSLKIGSDISSGFDSSLIGYLIKKNYTNPFICFCGISEVTKDDTDADIVELFAKRHDLKVKFINENNLYPFSSKEEVNVAKGSQNPILSSLILNFYRIISKSGVDIEFTGDGGDELYKSQQLEKSLLYSIQEDYFYRVKALKSGLFNILTKTGVEIFMDKHSFIEKDVFHSIISPSAFMLSQDLFELLWETNIWVFEPFMDNRLIEFFRRMPSKDGGENIFTKQEILKTREDIFIKEQFRPKKGQVGQVRLFLEKKSDLAVSILKNSVLGGLGIIKSPEIIDNLKRGNTKKYFEGDAMSFLLALLRLELYLQNNNIKI